MATKYPIVANCNYESGDERAREIHSARKAIDAGLTADADLLDAMTALEETLGEYSERSDMVAAEACREAEAAVLAAWTDDVCEAAQAERESRWYD